ncbi:MAG: glucose-6-phosphate dehydrogenase, partial [Anaerolineae bacterium]
MPVPDSEATTVFIFGASGDLTRRKLVPAIHSLNCEGVLHPHTRIVGSARTPVERTEYMASLLDGVSEYARLKPGMCERWDLFSERVHYHA